MWARTGAMGSVSGETDNVIAKDQAVWENPLLSDHAEHVFLGGVLMMGFARSLYTEDAMEMTITSGVWQNVKGNVVITS